MNIFGLDNYRSLIREYLAAQPKNGRGELARFAQHLNVNSTLVSQIMSGQRDFSIEQALSLSQYMGLAEIEAEYFILLVHKERAGTQELKKYYQIKIEDLLAKAKKIENRYEHDKKLDEAERGVFYSSWIYSAIRLYCSIGENGQTLAEICQRFQIDRTRIVEILHFLEKSGLCTQENGKYKMAVQRTFIERSSPHFLKHHSNWRIKAVELADSTKENEILFTNPISISKKDFNYLQEEILKLIKQVSQVVKDSPAEDLACLNIDFFWIRK